MSCPDRLLTAAGCSSCTALLASQEVRVQQRDGDELFTSRHRPRRGGASGRLRPSPSGSSPWRPGRPEPLGEQGRVRRRSPGMRVSFRLFC
jgi:hypothetical protein